MPNPPTFALPIEIKPTVWQRKGSEESPKRSLKEWKQQQRKSGIYGKVMLAKNIDNMTVISREIDSQCQNFFTMESLILAQDER